MGKADGVSRSFRRTLSRELARWREEEVVSAEQASHLADRYSLETLDRESANFAVYAIYLVGGALVCGGAVSFVAAHWEAIPAAVKLVLIVGAMIAAHAGGYHLWKVRGDWQRLGHALVTLGTLIFGANIGLVAQIFHIHSNFYNGFAAWAVGALAVAWAVRSVPNAFIVAVTSFIWFCGWIDDNPHAFCFYPFLILAALMPLAYLERSATVFLSALIAAGASIVICAGFDGEQGLALTLAWAAAAALGLSWGLFSRSHERTRSFAVPAMGVALAALAALAYALSFIGVAKEATNAHPYYRYAPDMTVMQGWLWTVPTGAAFVGAVALPAFGTKRILAVREILPLVFGGVAALALVVLGVVIQSWMTLIILATAACILLAGGLAWSGVRLRDRRLIWSGVLFGALTVVSRFLEYETGLLVKSAAFLVSGAALIYVGVKVESYLKRKAAP